MFLLTDNLFPILEKRKHSLLFTEVKRHASFDANLPAATSDEQSSVFKEKHSPNFKVNKKSYGNRQTNVKTMPSPILPVLPQSIDNDSLYEIYSVTNISS